MELRKDPITRSWVICGDEPEPALSSGSLCPFCPESGLPLQVVATSPTVNGSPWSARAVVHPHPLYGIDGEPSRSGYGIYDTMRPVGAHEVLVENARHDRHLWNADDREIEEYLALCGKRIQDLKGDVRFKYISVFKNFGSMSGQEFDHPTSEIVATTFVPRRVLYELRAAREHYRVKERCVFCDILHQEQEQKIRVVEVRGEYLATCPYAPRVPYETWIAPRNHEALFERTALKSGAMRDFAALLRRTLVPHSHHCRRLPHSAAHLAQHAASLGNTRLLEDHRRRLPLASGNPAHHRHQSEVVYLQGGVLLAGKLRDRGGNSAGAAYGVTLSRQIAVLQEAVRVERAIRPASKPVPCFSEPASAGGTLTHSPRAAVPRPIARRTRFAPS